MSLSLDELLDVRITGASLIEEKQRWAPVSTTVFTGEEIKRMGVESIEALMDYVPGFQSYQMGESGHSLPFSSRGRKVGTTSREVLVLLDGERVDTTLYGGGAFAVPLISTRSVERVEYLRGPGSALYGTGAFLGTVNIVTRRNARSYGAQVGANGSREAYLSASGDTGPLSYSVSLRAYEDDGERLAAYDPFSGFTETTDPFTGEDLSLGLELEGWRLTYRRNRRLAEDFYVVGTLKDGFNKYETVYESVHLRKSKDWSREHRTEFSLGWKDWEEQVRFVFLPEGYLSDVSEPASDAEFQANTLLREKEWGARAVHEWWFGSEGSLVFGGEWRSPRLKQGEAYSNYDLGALARGDFPLRYYGDLDQSTPLYAKNDREVLGAFGQLKTHLGHDWRLTLGLRYDRDSLVSSRISPRFGLVKDFGERGLVLKFLYSEAFRSPSSVEMFTMNNPLIIGNPGLKPEVVETWEVVALKEFENQALSASLFENRFRDSIVNGFIDGTRTFVNSEEERNRGLELEYRIQASESLLLRSSYTRFFSQPESTFREASSLASWAANYELDRWNVSLGSSYHGERSMLTPVEGEHLELDSYWSTRGSIRYEVNEAVDLYVHVLNALDERFQTPPQVETLISGLENRGRQFRIGFDAEF
ncbi:TonB-dependent receptor [Pelagicoccus sp. SDUM812005]|uniref:TonB-dependent receptor plug domain-containing protein n=1 Tax=Pelagicoccus sp. SDUM812005 TaxID=3041257 RepID=UPI002810A166|nr:TonB-dependent receptor [Pelagicoccus sp. SDUM812005]